MLLGFGAIAETAREQVASGEWLAAAASLGELPADAPLADKLLKLDLWLHLGRISAGRELATAVCAAHPESSQARVLAAKLAWAGGDLEAATKHAAAATALAPEDPEALLTQFQLADLRGQEALAEQLRKNVRDLARSSKRTAPLLNALAGVTAATDPHGAWASWQRAAKLDERYVQALLDGGWHCYDKYAWNYAQECFEKVLEAQPNHPEAHAGMAATAVANTAYDAAMAHIEAALAINPHHVQAKLLKATILLAERRPEDSLREVQQALETNPADIEALGMLAAHFDGVGDVDQRDEAINRARAVNPKSPAIYNLLADAADHRYQFAQGVAWAREAIKLDPEDWQGLYQAGCGLLRLGEEREGYDLLDKAFSRNGFNIWAYNMLMVLDKDFKKKEFVYRETEHFFVKMDADDDRVLWPYLGPALEAIWDAQVTKYDYAPKGPKETGGKVLILFLPSHGYFSARTVGLPGMHAAGACFGQVITMPSPRINKRESHPMNWVKVLEHEFAHVIALQRSDYRVPRWFTEGLSTHEEEDSNVSYDSLLKWAVDNDKLLPIEEMNVAFSRPKFGGQIPLSYYHASLVCDYLVETWGFEVVLKLLDGYAAGKKTADLFPEVCGKPLAEINAEILSYVRKRADKIKVEQPPRKDRLETLEAKQKLEELNVREWTELAWAYLEAEDADQAAMAAEMADTAGNKGEAQLILGLIAWRDDPKSAAAKERFLRARELMPAHPAPALYLGLMAKEAQDDAQAVKWFETAAALGPRTVRGETSPYPHLLELYQLNGEPAKAIALLETWTAIDYMNVKALRTLGELHLATGNLQKAGETFQQLIELNPYGVEIHELAADVWFQTGKLDQAERSWRVILALDPRNLPILHRMIQHLVDTNRNDEARTLLDRISFFAPDDPKAAKFRIELDAKP